MHRKHTLSLLAFLLIFVYSCQTKKDTVDLSMKWVKDQPYSYNNIADIATEMNIMGSKQSIEVKTSMYNTLKLLQTNGKEHTVQFTYDSIRNTSSVLNNNPEATNAENEMSFMEGKSVTVLLREGKIVQVDHADSLFAPLQDSLQKKIVSELFSADNMNGSFAMYFNFYPGKPVSVGDQWTSKVNMKVSSLKLSMKFNYTLQSVKDGLAEIAFTATSDDQGKMELNGVEIPVTFKGNQSGTYLVKLDDGTLKNANSVCEFDMTINMAGMELPMTMKVKNEVKKL
ncbi:MAG TPA: DUF6263 family protein [Ferruginibacter sp.]|nr:DUF6263 family protein [Ferruginibacter sp.]HRO07065.1 DUF6263 family protein [Ferruginibacter sp.]HRO97355.1 DUF6263 family protein [Ferruginibacter sp.]HRP50570.1 DUF6263 family protein [Ferruginibacter sp.]